jgi:hypothetical protein
MNPVHSLLHYLANTILILSSHLCLDHQSLLFRSSLPATTQCAFLFQEVISKLNSTMQELSYIALRILIILKMFKVL